MDLLSPERLMKIVSIGGHRMHFDQAEGLLESCILHFYHVNCGYVEMDKIRRMVDKVKYRVKRLMQTVTYKANEVQQMTKVFEVQMLKDYIADFYTAVNADRDINTAEISSLEEDVEDLRGRLLRLKPEELEKLLAKAEVRAACTDLAMLHSLQSLNLDGLDGLCGRTMKRTPQHMGGTGF